ncbi:MAG: ABC transporter ATP-binding protein [Armatimonadota bacterium]|nr:ABC transporter ATP-binding protein [Armatimonadota bacterium]MDR7497840.1 ABC transporter ATP-binding protein [Armatimonadota bacterium]MDR7512389.1 ABC transporter ATP-binding protein [Armatimonadota bacterium]
MAAVTLLRTEGLRRAFGGLQAVRGVDLELAPGEIRAIIGPNGAGKTTLVGMISGRVAPTAGRVLFRGRDITRLPAHDRVMLGIVYTFQIMSIYRALPVFDNLALPVQRRLMRTALDRLALDPRAVARGVEAALGRIGLQDVAAQPAGALPYGHQRLLDIAMALALEPEVLILDEPTQGLAPDEIARLLDLIRRIASEVTIVLIEHNMQVVLEVARRVTVMDAGRVLAEGTPAEIEANPDVQRVYLGQ